MAARSYYKVPVQLFKLLFFKKVDEKIGSKSDEDTFLYRLNLVCHWLKLVEIPAQELLCPEEIAPVLRVIRRSFCVLSLVGEEGLFLPTFVATFQVTDK